MSSLRSVERRRAPTVDHQRPDEARDTVRKLKGINKRLMEDPESRDEYLQPEDEFPLIEALFRTRATAKLSQVELARHLGSTQSALARLERCRVLPSFSTLPRCARATATRLIVGPEPAEGLGNRS